MGVLSFPVQKLVEGEVFDGWFDLMDMVNKPLKGCSMRATLSFRQAAPPKMQIMQPSVDSPGLTCSGVPLPIPFQDVRRDTATLCANTLRNRRLCTSPTPCCVTATSLLQPKALVSWR